MAIRWKKYEMYGPKKPGWIKKCFWYCKEKCTTMTGLYLISVILLMIFTDVFVQWGFDADYSLILPVTTKQMGETTPRPRFSGLSIEKARRELGYQPHTLEEGIKLMFNL